MNFKLEPTIDGKGFKIKARIKREGRDLKKQETFIGSRRQASRRGQELVKELEKKAEIQSPSRSLKTFGACIEYYRERHGIKKSDEYCFKKLDTELGHLSIERVPDALNSFVLWLSKSISYRGKPFSPATLNRFQQWAKTILNFAADWGKIEENPLTKIKRFKETPRDTSLSEEERERLLTAIKEHSPHLLPITLFAIQVPSRKGELVNLKYSDIDMVNNLIRIKNGKTKNGKGVTKPIPPNLVDYFRSIPAESEYAFYRFEYGKYKKLGDFKKAWMKARVAAGLPELTFHDLRHYSATQLVHIGLSERQVMQVAGWKTNMLSTYYNKDGFGAAKAVFSALESKVSPFDNSNNEKNSEMALPERDR